MYIYIYIYVYIYTHIHTLYLSGSSYSLLWDFGLWGPFRSIKTQKFRNTHKALGFRVWAQGSLQSRVERDWEKGPQAVNLLRKDTIQAGNLRGLHK